MKKIIILLFIIASLSGVCQRYISEYEAVVAAKKVMSERGVITNQVNHVYCDVSYQGDTLLYEVIINNGYAVLLSGTKNYTPVLAVYKNSTGQSIFNQDEHHGPAILVNNYRSQIETSMIDRTRQEDSMQWCYLLDTTRLIGTPRAVSHILTSSWGESKSNDGIDLVAYNDNCPCIGGCYAPAGSAAVAMGQIMYFWNYPFFPLSNISSFDWCNMGDDLYTTDVCYDIKKKAISHLLYQCGVAAQSNYTCYGTQTSPGNVVSAMRNVFYYHTKSQFERGPFAPDPDHPELAILFEDYWDKIKEDINHGRPIIGYLKRESEKHFFVCDGYTNNYRILINWGDLDNNFNGEYSIFNALDLYLLFEVYPQIRYTIGDSLYLSHYYTSCASQIGSSPLYSVVPYMSNILISASSTSSLSWRTIPTGATAIYQAHEEIILQDGFEAQLGCEFEARIEPCEQCDEMRDKNSFNSDDNANDNNFGSEDTPPYSTGGKPQSVDPALFPNPTDGPLTMYTAGEPQEVFVYTLDGRLAGGWKLTALGDDFVSINVSSLHPGPYILSVATPSGLRTARFIRR